MGISWPHSGSLTFLVFFALVPFLLAEHVVYTRRLRTWRVVVFSYLMCSIFNFIACNWIMHASMGGMIMAVFVNALLMTGFIWLFHLVHRRYGNYWGYAALVSLWMCYEYCHYHWELSWPWLNFGNVFATHTSWVQWYEYTGVGGGTLWILLANLAAFALVKNIYILQKPLKKCMPSAAVFLAVVLVPIVISWAQYSRYTEQANPINVVVVQPNIDPYGDKFSNMTGEEQVIVFLREAFMQSDSTVDFVVGPETALPYSIEESEIDESAEVELMRRAFALMRHTAVVIGMSSHRVYKAGEKMPPNARAYPDGSGVEFYNSALFLKPGPVGHAIYHKSKLVLGVEKIPFAKLFPFLEKLALDMGGTSGTLGIEKGPVLFSAPGSKARIAPSICYESIYGEHMGAFVMAGANVLFVITNDGWWGNTAGYKQHIDYARLTAISLRRSIAQSANTGISGFIDQRGDIVAKTEWWTTTALRHTINLNSELTFYARHGDLLYRTGMYFSIAFILLYLYAFATGKNYVSRREV